MSQITMGNNAYYIRQTIQFKQLMHKCLPITPQKKDKLDLKELSPLPQHLRSHLHRSSRLEILQSPMTPHKDLFSQLLSPKEQHTLAPLAESPFGEPYQLNFQIMEEEQSSEPVSRTQNEGSYEDDEMFSLQQNEEDEAGMKKRKRKSTAQIKMLKAQLEQEPTWSKEKIVEVSELTGLSQSQVYKWWWDQKKKNTKHETHHDKRKLIRKDTQRRGMPYDRQNEGYYIDESMLTKVKTAIEVEEGPQTEKRINKRLVFV